MVIGMKFMVTFIKQRAGNYISPDFIKVSLSILVICAVFSKNLPVNYRASDTLAHEYANTVLHSLEKNSIFFTFADLDTGPIGYMHKIENVRPDITLYNSNGLVFSNRLYRPFISNRNERLAKIDNLITNSKRPVNYSTELRHEYGIIDYGLYARIDTSLNPDARIIIIRPVIKDFYERILNRSPPVDHWEAIFYKLLESQYCRISAGQIIFAENQGDDAFDLRQIERLCRTYYGYIELIKLMLDQNEPKLDIIENLLNKAETMRVQAFRKSDYIETDIMWAEYYRHLGDDVLAMEYLQQAVQKWPNVNNRAYKLLAEIR
jgi:hypothetical protein